MLLEKIIKEILTDFTYEIKVTNDLFYLYISNDELRDVLLKLKNDSFKVLIDCFATNTVSHDGSNDIYYHLLSYKYNKDLCIYTSVQNKSTQSIIDIFPNAKWYEREIYEMYDINFIGHDNLTKLFTNNF